MINRIDRGIFLISGYICRTPSSQYSHTRAFSNSGGYVKIIKINKMESLQKIELKIKKALRNQKSYSKDLDTCITMAAGSYYAFLVALEDIKELDKSYVIEKSREGNDRMVPHPAFRVLKVYARDGEKALPSRIRAYIRNLIYRG